METVIKINIEECCLHYSIERTFVEALSDNNIIELIMLLHMTMPRLKKDPLRPLTDEVVALLTKLSRSTSSRSPESPEPH